MINVNDTFRKEPDAGKPHVRNFCEGRTTARGASTRPINMGVIQQIIWRRFCQFIWRQIQVLIV